MDICIGNSKVVQNRAQKQAIHTWHSIKAALGIGRNKMDHSVNGTGTNQVI